VIELRRPVHSDTADAVAARLGDMVVAHRLVIDPTLTDPVLVDGERRASGDQIEPFLAELASDLADWNRFQSDSCYIGDDGRTC